MDILLNGDHRTIASSASVADLLSELKIENRYCAVERNGSVVPREQHAACQLQPGDQVEIVTLVGGG